MLPHSSFCATPRVGHCTLGRQSAEELMAPCPAALHLFPSRQHCIYLLRNYLQTWITDVSTLSLPLLTVTNKDVIPVRANEETRSPPWLLSASGLSGAVPMVLASDHGSHPPCVSASCSEQVEERVHGPTLGHPHLCGFWHSPGQVQVSLLSGHSGLSCTR